MSNTISNFAPPADFKRFLQTQKGIFGSAEAKQYAEFCAEYDRTQAERKKYSRDEAEALISRIRGNAESNPTSENLAALANCNPDDIRCKFETVNNSLAEVQRKVLGRARPLLKRIGEIAVASVDKEIARLERDNRATFEKYGVNYAAETDPLLKSLARFRDITAQQFCGDGAGMSPKQIADRVGEIRAK